MKQSLGRFILVSLMVLPFLSCSQDDGFNEDVQFDVVPDVPFTILTDTTIGSGDDAVDIAAPWFLAGFTIVNRNTDYYLFVPSLSITVSAFKDGQQVGDDYTSVLDANSACPFDDDPPRVRYATIPPAPDSSTGSAHLGDADCDASDLTDRALFYINGLPEADSTAYFVTVTLEGFMFNDNSNDDDPVKGRVRKVISFSTQ